MNPLHVLLQRLPPTPQAVELVDRQLLGRRLHLQTLDLLRTMLGLPPVLAAALENLHVDVGLGRRPVHPLRAALVVVGDQSRIQPAKELALARLPRSELDVARVLLRTNLVREGLLSLRLLRVQLCSMLARHRLRRWALGAVGHQPEPAPQVQEVARVNSRPGLGGDGIPLREVLDRLRARHALPLHPQPDPLLYGDLRGRGLMPETSRQGLQARAAQLLLRRPATQPLGQRPHERYDFLRPFALDSQPDGRSRALLRQKLLTADAQRLGRDGQLPADGASVHFRALRHLLGSFHHRHDRGPPCDARRPQHSKHVSCGSFMASLMAPYASRARSTSRSRTPSTVPVRCTRLPL